MPRFKWNDPRAGRVINRYIDMICKDYPSIARDVVKHGIGELDSWFERDDKDSYCSADALNATCGCLVGTTALVAVNRMPKAVKKIRSELEGQYDGAEALYSLIVAKTGRDISKYRTVDDTSMIATVGPKAKAENKGLDPLLVLIYQAGIEASSETNLSDYGDDYEIAQVARTRQVVDHMENRIRTNLNIPYPKVVKKNASQKTV